MIDGTFVTVTGFRHYRDRVPFSIGAELLCCKEPENAYDTEAIKVVAEDDGSRVGYIANSANTKANGTMSAVRIYDKVGDFFLVEVCFSTQTKIICRITDFNVTDETTLERFRDKNEIIESSFGEPIDWYDLEEIKF